MTSISKFLRGSRWISDGSGIAGLEQSGGVCKVAFSFLAKESVEAGLRRGQFLEKSWKISGKIWGKFHGSQHGNWKIGWYRLEVLAVHPWQHDANRVFFPMEIPHVSMNVFLSRQSPGCFWLHLFPSMLGCWSDTWNLPISDSFTCVGGALTMTRFVHYLSLFDICFARARDFGLNLLEMQFFHCLNASLVELHPI